MSTEIAALIKLLDDDSSTVLQAVTDRLEQLLPESLPALRDACESEDARVRSRARELLRVLPLRRCIPVLIEMAEAGDPDLETMSFQLARVQEPTLDFAELARRLDELAERVRVALGPELRGRERLEAFLRVLHDDLGFRGDTEDYNAWDNNFLNRVLERRRGIPITLVLVYILIGRRVDLDIRAVGAPYRALAHHESSGFETFIDAFAGGRLHNYHDCISHLKGLGVSSPNPRQHLRRLSAREVMERMVRNIINHCDQAQRPQEGREFKRLARALVGNRDKDRLA
ncbi:MAG: hypothetical protein H6807_09480 [Planctomycetes bacterium]|nr:hypothetical protein [Planctomycetota bacterium]